MTTRPQRKRNVGGAVGLLIVAAGTLIFGLYLLSHLDHCGDQVMRHGDVCPNQSRTRSWTNDYEHQMAARHRAGVAMIAFSATATGASGLVYAFTDPTSRKRRDRNAR